MNSSWLSTFGLSVFTASWIALGLWIAARVMDTKTAVSKLEVNQPHFTNDELDAWEKVRVAFEREQIRIQNQSQGTVRLNLPSPTIQTWIIQTDTKPITIK